MAVGGWRAAYTALVWRAPTTRRAAANAWKNKWARRQQVRSHATAAANAKPAEPASRGGKTILGTTAGSMALVISGSVLAWPLGDLFLGPWLCSVGLQAFAAASDVEDSRTPLPEELRVEGVHLSSSARRAPGDAEESDAERSAQKVLAADETGVRLSTVSGRAFEAAALRAGRPCVYLSLRESTSAGGVDKF